MFLLVIGDDWPQIATLYIRAKKELGFVYEISAYLYFITSLITGCIILQSLMTALLLKNFQQSWSLDEENKKFREEDRELQITKLMNTSVAPNQA